MDLLSKYAEAYCDSEEDDDQKEMIVPKTVELAPEVDIKDLEHEKLNKELTRFETTNKLITK